jgi:hypothetical protein
MGKLIEQPWMNQQGSDTMKESKRKREKERILSLYIFSIMYYTLYCYLYL